MTTDLYTHVSEEKKKEVVAELKILAYIWSKNGVNQKIDSEKQRKINIFE